MRRLMTVPLFVAMVVVVLTAGVALAVTPSAEVTSAAITTSTGGPVTVTGIGGRITCNVNLSYTGKAEAVDTTLGRSIFSEKIGGPCNDTNDFWHVIQGQSTGSAACGDPISYRGTVHISNGTVIPIKPFKFPAYCPP